MAQEADVCLSCVDATPATQHVLQSEALKAMPLGNAGMAAVKDNPQLEAHAAFFQEIFEAGDGGQDFTGGIIGDGGDIDLVANQAGQAVIVRRSARIAKQERVDLSLIHI